MANINDIESLFSLIDQSPNDYKEFYHEKNGLHALDKWSYLKNIQLENPLEEGISIFETSPKQPETVKPIEVAIPVPPKSPVVSEAPTIISPVILENPVEKKTTPFKPVESIDTTISTPSKLNAPLISATDPLITPPEPQAKPITSVVEPVPTTFQPDPIPPTTKLEPVEPVVPQIYNPGATPAPAPKVFSTTAIPTVPTFTPIFKSAGTPSTSPAFKPEFMNPPVPTPTSIQSTFTPPPANPLPSAVLSNVKPQNTAEQTTKPLNSIFSRLEQK